MLLSGPTGLFGLLYILVLYLFPYVMIVFIINASAKAKKYIVEDLQTPLKYAMIAGLLVYLLILFIFVL